MKKTFLSILMLNLGFTLAAQTVFNGTIKDNEGKALPNVYIMLSAKGSPLILAYAASDANGQYSVSYKGDADTVCISVSRLDYKKESVCIPNKARQLNFSLPPEITQLREVVIKPEKVWRNRDTVNYSVREFTNKDDRSIADVLKRMPGIEVSSSGNIKYNGESINKFYVENMDLMGGQYNVISKNLNNRHVETVQVYENHEPVKAMQETSMSDKAAINLVLKDDAKAKWLASGKFGIGLEPLLWDNELSLMRFAKHTQGTYMYKNNNAGNNISNDLLAHYGAFSTMQKTGVLGIPTSTPGISETKRYLFNNAHLLTVNQLWKLSKDYELRLNADYLNDYQKRNNSGKTTYYLNDEEIVVEEQSYTAININKAKASLTLTGNHPKYYLYNTIRGQADWSHEHAAISGNQQYLKNPYYNISNDFMWLKVFGKSKFEIRSNNRYNSQPQRLSMSPGLYENIFNNGNIYDVLQQKATLNDFQSDNSLVYTKTKGRWSQNYTAGFKLILQDLDSELGLQGAAIIDSFSNNASFSEARAYIKPQFDYVGKKMRATLGLPAGYLLLNSKDKSKNIRNDKNHFYFNPSLYFKYDLNVLWNISLRAAYTDWYSDVNSLYAGYILNNYRSIMKNDGSFSKIEGQTYGFTVSYRDPIKLANAYVSLSYSRFHSDNLFKQDFDGILSIRKKFDYANNTGSKSINVSASKGFDKYVKKVQLWASYGINTYNQLQADSPAEYRRNVLSANLSLESNISSWLNCHYLFNFANSKSDLKGNNVNVNYSSINRYEHKFKVNVFPVKNLQLGMNAEYENSSAETRLPSAFFMDFNVKYKFKKLEFELHWNNIFDERNYVIASYGDFYSSYNIYELRPANFIFTLRFSL
ncbi:MAG: outer membrane beta-barrel family protein [Prevotellaceae bacterium]|jgi:hypothetical protein|nr:outer membrane beta-barrel family protein [Prevotellaceae bacterium]